MRHYMFKSFFVEQGDFSEIFCDKQLCFELSKNVFLLSISFTVTEMHIQHICWMKLSVEYA